jgi:ribosomal protein S18 acetylase RimI-like enzyme
MPPPIIRPFHPADDAACARLFAPHAQINWPHLRAAGLAAQVLVFNGRLRGYAAALPVPGLPGLGDLIGIIDPAHRRQGLGTLLLDHLCVWLPAAGIREIAVPVSDLQHPLTRFLQRRQFHLHHEEITLRCEFAVGNSAISVDIPPATGDNSPQIGENGSEFAEKSQFYGDNHNADRGETGEKLLRIGTFSRRRALDLFLQLYPRAFAHTPWQQPFSRLEADGLLAQPADLKFLLRDDEPVGFAWCSTEKTGVVEIEPLGIIRELQGQGYGHWFLAHLLRDWRRAGTPAVQLALWRENRPALRLYRGLGFRQVATTYYLQRSL